MSNQPGIEEAAGASPGGSQAQAPDAPQALPVRRPRDAKDKYVFWETQPVPQFSGLEPAQVGTALHYVRKRRSDVQGIMDGCRPGLANCSK
eukprot:1140511-Pelagomonas_calceolata.AAC.4